MNNKICWWFILSFTEIIHKNNKIFVGGLYYRSLRSFIRTISFLLVVYTIVQKNNKFCWWFILSFTEVIHKNNKFFVGGLYYRSLEQ